MDEIITAEQVASMLQVHVRTVYRLARRGAIPGKKLGGGWRFSKGVIMQLLAREEQNGKVIKTDLAGVS
ncbi:MAG TPA: helix-turn-helix domain-containing protein [Candidatus Binatia bacterium]